MSIASAIRNYLAPLGFSVREIREENECARVNREAAAQLIREERSFWEARMAKAATHGEREAIQDELDRLAVIERAS